MGADTLPVLLVVSAVLGLGYVPFVYASAQQAPPSNDKVEVLASDDKKIAQFF